MARALIVGAGIAGLAAAIHLRRVGWEVLVVERERGRERPGHGFLVQASGLAGLTRLGLADGIAGWGQELGSFQLFTPSGELLYAAALQQTLGFTRRRFVDRLQAAVPEGTVAFGRYAVESVAGAEGVVQALRLDDGAELEADLFVAADGLRSRLRRELFPDAALTAVRVVELVCHVDDAELAAELGGTFRKWQVPEGGLALGMVPCGGARVVWYLQLDVARHVISGETAEARRELAQRSVGTWAAPLPRLLECTDFARSHLWLTADLDPLPALHRGNVALVGDAAHVFLPFTSQGANAALDDALALGDCVGPLAGGWSQAQGEAALEAYTALRRPVLAAVVEGGRALRERFLHPERHVGAGVVPLVK